MIQNCWWYTFVTNCSGHKKQTVRWTCWLWDQKNKEDSSSVSYMMMKNPKIMAKWGQFWNQVNFILCCCFFVLFFMLTFPPKLSLLMVSRGIFDIKLTFLNSRWLFLNLKFNKRKIALTSFFVLILESKLCQFSHSFFLLIKVLLYTIVGMIKNIPYFITFPI